VAKKTTAKVSIEILNYLFFEFDIWAKIQDGRLSSIVIANTLSPDRYGRNATSMIIKHFKPNGKHIATTHCVKDNQSGCVLHQDEKDLIVGDIKLTRLQPPPESA